MLFCSRNARPPKALVGRAQWEHNRRPRYFCHSAAWEGGRKGTRVVLCSRSAHDQNVLARRAQWDQHGRSSKSGIASKLALTSALSRSITCVTLLFARKP
jgi:hypothetical protein